MNETIRIIAMASIAWTAIALLVQWVQSKGYRRKDYSAKAGNPIKGIIYNFTYAMTPSHKESIKLHPLEFTVGVIMHIGIFVSIAKAVIALINPQLATHSHLILAVILAAAIICALIQLFRRILSKELRSISTFDDYLAIVIVSDFLISAFLQEKGVISLTAFLIHATIVFIYMPIGKLRHVLFFFAVRTDFGARLGYRGTYPSKSQQ